MLQEIADALVQSWRNFATAFVLFVPRFVAAIIIFGGGFAVSLLVRRVIQRLFTASYSLTDSASIPPIVIGGSSMRIPGSSDSATNP